MTQVTVSLPDDLVQRAHNAGLLSNQAIDQLLEDAMRRDAERQLLQLAEDIQTAGITPMSMKEIDAEVKAYRATRRAHRT